MIIKKDLICFIVVLILLTINFSGCIDPSEFTPTPIGPLKHPKSPSICVDSNLNTHIIWNIDKGKHYSIRYVKINSNNIIIINKTISNGIVYLSNLLMDPNNQKLHYFYGNNYLQLNTNGDLLFKKELLEISRYYDKYDITRDFDVTIDAMGNLHLLWINQNLTITYEKLNNNGELIYRKDLGNFIDNINFDAGTMLFSFQIEIDSVGILHTLWKSGYNRYDTNTRKIYGVNKTIYGDYFKLDSMDNLHIRSEKTYIKLSSSGIKLKSNSIRILTPINGHPIINDNNTYLYLNENGLVDDNYHVHIITTEVKTKTWTSGRYYEDYDFYTIYYNKIDKNGTILINNMTIDSDSEPTWETGKYTTQLIFYVLLISIPILIIILIFTKFFIFNKKRKKNKNGNNKKEIND